MRSAGVGATEGRGAGRGCHAACIAGAWRPRGKRVLTRSGAARGNERGEREARRGPGPAKRLLGQGEARGAVGRVRERARSEAAAQ